ncbi:MAG: trimethylamine methyltransferase family protein [Deltaproteobacteria bacterium]|nr:trimethylamine methyltransferase family protein [Deltaproteobacteria bacterium]
MFDINNTLTEQDREKIFNAALSVLTRVGFVCNHQEAIEAFQSGGCTIGDKVTNSEGGRKILFTEEIVTDALKKIPTAGSLYPTSPSPRYTTIKLNTDASYYINTGGDYIWDYELNKMRPGTIGDMVKNARLLDACEHFDGCMPPIYWLYDEFPKEDFSRYGALTISMAICCLHNGGAKIIPYFSSHKDEISDYIRIWQLCAGGEAAFRKKPNATSVVCPISPYFLSGRQQPDDPIGHADLLLTAAKSGVPITLGPCGILGISGPVTVAGLVAQSVAEFLGMNVAIQAINPGNIMMFQSYTAAGEMHTGVRAESSPQAMQVHIGFQAMGQYLNVQPPPKPMRNLAGNIWRRICPRRCSEVGLSGAGLPYARMTPMIPWPR